MMQNYTQNDLIRYIYKDTSVTEYFEIEDAIENDRELYLKYLELYNAFKALPKLNFRPSRNTIDRLLSYSNTLVSGAHC